MSKGLTRLYFYAIIVYGEVFVLNVLATCTNCHKQLNIADHFFEREVLVDNDKLLLTLLVCPHCGTEIVTQIDNTDSLRLFQRQVKLFKRMAATKSVKGHATPTQEGRQEDITKALSAVRNDLAAKYNHTSYQFDGKECKLDIHVPNMTISEVE